MNRTLAFPLVVASSVLVAGWAPFALAGGVPTLAWTVHDQTSGQVIEIAKPTGAVTLDGNHRFDVKLVVKNPGRATQISIGGRIVGLQCTGENAQRGGKPVRRALPQHIAPAPQGEPAQAALTFNGDGIPLCSGAGQDHVKVGKILVHGSSTDKRDALYQATGTLTINLVPGTP
jgi:hypothetical protein